jgi:ribosomal protein S18 acetylase RimI-like enzyme
MSASPSTSTGTGSSSAVQPPEPRRDAWLSDVLGFDAWTATVESAAVVPAGARSLTTVRIPVQDVASLGAVETLGFSPVDVNVTLERVGFDLAPPSSVAVATPDESEALLDVAGSCFRYSRFHLDPRIPREAADRVKREWVRSYVDGRRGIELLAAATVGFLAVLEAPDGARVIDLVGVAPSAQGRGVGEELVVAFASRHGAGERTLRVGTQIANVPSLRLYEKLGFRIVSASYVLHRHVGA